MARGATYAAAGVDLARKDEAVERIVRLAQRTFGPGVIPNPGGFAGLFALRPAKLFDRMGPNPVLVACADGVGTKLRIASAMGRHRGVGIDLVAMNVNDLICAGGTPLCFLDYIAMGKIDERVLGELTEGMVEACREVPCALLGGETAEMPGHYPDGEYDLAGFAVGIVDRSKILDGRWVTAGDDLVGLASSGLHSNGFSLVRKVLLEGGRYKLPDRIAELGKPLGEELLAPTRLYPAILGDLLRNYKVKKVVKAVAHITGSGIPGNLPRVIPKGLGAEIELGTWEEPPIFDVVRRAGGIEDEEMRNVFNLGVGLILVVNPHFTAAILKRLGRRGQKAWRIGKVVPGEPGVRFVRG